MNTDTIDHNTLTNLIASGVICNAQVIGQVGGWGVLIRHGHNECPLAATRSKKTRLFKKLETLVVYLKDMGINQFDVDASHFDSNKLKTYARPDRAEALRIAHQAVTHDQWFREQVGLALQEADDPETVWTSHEQAKAAMQRQRERLLSRLETTR